MSKRFLILFASLFFVFSTKIVLAGDDAANTSTATETSAANTKSTTAVNIVKILKSLKAKGYNVVYKVVVDQGHIEVKALDIQGKGIKLTFDPQGHVIEPKDFEKQTPVINMLEAVTKANDAGYKNIGLVVLDDDNNYLILTNNHAGKVMKVLVDSKTGKITEKSE